MDQEQRRDQYENHKHMVVSDTHLWQIEMVFKLSTQWFIYAPLKNPLGIYYFN